MSKPELGSLIGIFAGALIGVVCIGYFEITPWFDRLCLAGSAILISQLLGATLAATVGKPNNGGEVN